MKKQIFEADLSGGFVPRTSVVEWCFFRQKNRYIVHCNLSPQIHYVATNYGGTPSTVPPPPCTSTSFPTPITDDPDPASLLPLTPPPTPLLLWLSERVVQWKFLGRYLDVKEHDLDRISLENQNDIREQCFQMLKRFSMEAGPRSTCQRLGRALLESERNKHLFAEFCEKVGELLSNES